MRNCFLLVLFVAALGARAAVLPPEKLLPKDTALVVTIPDCATGWSLLTSSPYGRLWQDPQLRPFKDRFIDKFTANLLEPVEKTLSVRFSSYQDLARGQATFALVPINEPDRPDDHFAKIFLLDTKDRADQLRTNLTEIKQKWQAAGKPMKSRKIRELDFTTLIVNSDDLSWDKLTSKPAPATPTPDDPAEKTTPTKTEITFGQVDSLLVVSDSAAAIEKVISRQTGGLVPALEEQPAFQNDYAARLHGSPLYAWANVKGAIDVLTRVKPGPDGEDSSAAVREDSMLATAGLTGLTSACFSYKSAPEGMSAQLFIGVPESKRRGLLKALVNETKDANPPPFVPADAAKFWRWRIDIPHAWTLLETTLTELNPQYGSVINFILQQAGKDKDEKYDLKSQLLGNLGDDVIHYEKAPQDNTLAALNSPPSLYLVGSPGAEKLAAAVKTGLTLMGAEKDREFLGRKITTVTMGGPAGATSHALSFSGSGPYVAFSDEGGILEEYLRSDENKARALSETPGLADAAQRVGGMGLGIFGYDNQSLTMRAVVETLRKQPVTLQDILGTSPLGAGTAEETAKVKEWADFSLLPPYDSIAQYFYFSVYAGTFSPDGFTMNFFSPTPPKLR